MEAERERERINKQEGVFPSNDIRAYNLHTNRLKAHDPALPDHNTALLTPGNLNKVLLSQITAGADEEMR